MEIIAKCPGCGQSYQFDVDAADKRARCPKCRTLFKLPHPDELASAAEILKNARKAIYVDENGRVYG